MKTIYISLLAFLVLSAFSTYTPGGHTLSFDSPGEGFEKSEDGKSYEHAEDNAILKGDLVSQSYEDFKSQMDKRLSSIEEIKVLSKGEEKLGRHHGYLIKMTRQVDSENAMITMVFMFPAGHGMTGNLTATFPESLEEKYSKAMLNAMGTARMVHNH